VLRRTSGFAGCTRPDRGNSDWLSLLTRSNIIQKLLFFFVRICCRNFICEGSNNYCITAYNTLCSCIINHPILQCSTELVNLHTLTTQTRSDIYLINNISLWETSQVLRPRRNRDSPLRKADGIAGPQRNKQPNELKEWLVICRRGSRIASRN
jgi:hypothetical protein